VGEIEQSLITVFQSGLRVAATRQCIDANIEKELMRGFLLNVTVENSNSIRPYIAPGNVIGVIGSNFDHIMLSKEILFDISGFTNAAGMNNVTDVQGKHVSYRLNNYILPPMYSLTHTKSTILRHILQSAKDVNEKAANEEFFIGEVYDDKIVTFDLKNEEEVSARSAIFSMKELGNEVEYDNFNIHLPERVGLDVGRTFKIGKDVVNLRRTWQEDNGTTYEMDIAALMRLPGAPGSLDELFDVGDNIIIDDEIIGGKANRRIISYNRNLIDPTQDKITLGVFVRDSSTNAINR